MIPLLLTIRIHRLRLWIPLIIIWLLLLPLVLVLLPFIVLACMITDIGAWHAFKTFWRVVWALPGTQIELTDGRHIFALKIY